MYQDYMLSFIGLWVILGTIIVQTSVAVAAHRRQKHMIPGVLDANLGHDSFVFRSDRTFRNSLENIIPFLGLSLIAIFTGYDAQDLSIIIGIYALARIIHMVLYYAIATEKNPSPRSYFYMIALLATFYLFIDLGIFLIAA